MKPAAIVSSQPVAGPRVDSQSASGGSESEFGPILQAAEQSAPVRPVRGNSDGSSRPGGSAAADRARGGPKRDASSTGTDHSDEAATSTSPTSAATSTAQSAASSPATSPPSSSDAASTAATADAAALNGAPAGSAGAVPADGPTQTGHATSAGDPTLADAVSAGDRTIASARTQAATAATDAAALAVDRASTWIAGQTLATGVQGQGSAQQPLAAKALPASSGTSRVAATVSARAPATAAAAGAQSQRGIAIDPDDAGDPEPPSTGALGAFDGAAQGATAGGPYRDPTGADADADEDPGAGIAAGTALSASARVADATALSGAAASGQTLGQTLLAAPRLADALSHAATPMQSVSPDLSNATPAPITGSYSAYGGAAYAAEARASVATPVGQNGFGQEFSERVLVLAHGGVQTAQISLQPAGLGPVGVSIQVNGHAATLAFTAQHEATRNAISAELPRLREMFAASGMQLSDATVGGREQPGWQAPDPQSLTRELPMGAGADGAASTPAASGEPPSGSPAAATLRLVDTYA